MPHVETQSHHNCTKFFRPAFRNISEAGTGALRSQDRGVQSVVDKETPARLTAQSRVQLLHYASILPHG